MPSGVLLGTEGRPGGLTLPLGSGSGVSVEDGRVVGLRFESGQGAPGQSAP